MTQKTLYYASSPSSENQTPIRFKVEHPLIQTIEKIYILGDLIDEKTVIVETTGKTYTFRFENLNEFRDFLLYFMHVRKTSNSQQLFAPPDCVM